MPPMANHGRSPLGGQRPRPAPARCAGVPAWWGSPRSGRGRSSRPRSARGRRRACSVLWLLSPISTSGPTIRRATAGARSRWPRCSTSAPAGHRQVGPVVDGQQPCRAAGRHRRTPPAARARRRPRGSSPAAGRCPPRRPAPRRRNSARSPRSRRESVHRYSRASASEGLLTGYPTSRESGRRPDRVRQPGLGRGRMEAMPLRGRTDAFPPQALLLIGIASVQFGAAFAAKLFDRAGPAGVVLLRLSFAALVLLALDPAPAGRPQPADLLVAAGFGLVLGGMNWSFYEAIQRLPLGRGGDHRVPRAAGGGDLRLAPAARPALGGCWPAAGWCCWPWRGSRARAESASGCCWRCWPGCSGRATSCSRSGSARPSPAWRAWRSRCRWRRVLTGPGRC